MIGLVKEKIMAFSADQKEFLQQPRVARLSVIDSRGYPHTVPIWFALDGNDLVFFSSRDARKIDYVKANPKGAVTIGGEPYGAEGYLLKGDFSLEEDDGHRWLSEITHRYEPQALADQHVKEWGQGDLVIMRFTAHKIAKV
jgi:general stress protein 26